MTRRWYKHILALAAICMLFSGLTTAYAGNTTEFMDGNGTAEDPYLISNTTHLLNAHLYPQAHFLLMKDLKISDPGFGNFSGVFDGGGHTISGLSCGSFVEELYGEIKNLTLDGTFTDGAFAETITETGKVTGCRSKGLVQGDENHKIVGGIAGTSSGIIDLCSNEADVITYMYGGGIVGELNGTVERSYNVGTVKSESSRNISATYIGGISGYSGTVKDSFNTGSIFGDAYRTSYAGGIFGQISKAVNCYNVGIVKGDYAGGIAGITTMILDYALKSMEDCYYLNNVGRSSGQFSGGDAYRCTAEQLRDKSTYQKFDFSDVWEMNTGKYGFPVLQENPFVNIPENTTDFAGGSGTFFAPYLISNEAQLKNVSLYPEGYFEVINDITLSGTNWTPLCSDGFQGIFDGGGYTISGLRYSTFYDANNAGLFESNEGVIRNVNMENVSIYTSGGHIGAVAAGGSGTFENCHVISGNLESRGGKSGFVGGICAGSGNFVDCSNAASIRVEKGLSAGGIGLGGTFDGCTNSGKISVNCSDPSVFEAIDVGGISSKSDGNVTGCINTGEITVSYVSDQKIYRVGGIIAVADGDHKKDTITGCLNTGSVTVYNNSSSVNTSAGLNSSYAGGIVAYSDVTVSQCRNTGDVNARTGYVSLYAGGIAAMVATNGLMVTDCVNSGSVSVSNHTSAGSSTHYYVGAIAGQADIVSTSYTASTAKNPLAHYGGGEGKIGLIVGSCNTLTNCYYLSEYSFLDGPLTDEQLRVKESYKGFDFENIWTFDPFSSYAYALPVCLVSKVEEVSLGDADGAVLETVEGVWPDLSGLTVTLTNANGKTVITALERWMLPDLDISQVGKQTISPWYPDVHAEDTITVLIQERMPLSISITKLPDRTKYLQNRDDLDLSGGTFSVTYDNGTNAEFDMTKAEVIGFDNTKAGQQKITLIYGGCTTDFEITILTRTGLSVYTLPNQISYIQGQPLDTTGLVVVEQYSDGSYAEVPTNLLTLTYDTAAVGDVPVTVSYLDFSGSFSIHVSPKQVESFVLTEPGKLSYIQGEDLDLTGGKLDIQYTAADGSGTPSYHEEVPLTASMISGYDKFGVTFDEQTLCYKPTYQTLTVTYGGQTEEFLVLVKPFVLSAQGFWEGETLQVQISLNEDVNAASCFFIAAAYRNGQMVEANMISADRSGQLSSRFYKIGPDDTVRLFVTDHSYHPLISAVDVYLER